MTIKVGILDLLKNLNLSLYKNNRTVDLIFIEYFYISPCKES